jgi:hypothetical protein
MFFHGPSKNTNNSTTSSSHPVEQSTNENQATQGRREPYSYDQEISNEDVREINQILPDMSPSKIHETLKIFHGDKDATCDWLLANNGNPHPPDHVHENCYYHPPVSQHHIHQNIYCVPPSNVACGQCGCIMTLSLPDDPLPAGSQLRCFCPNCDTVNIIPFVPIRATVKSIARIF